MPIEYTGRGELPSAFSVTDFAAESVGAAGTAIAELVACRSGSAPRVLVDRRLASMWFGFSIRPLGWKLPPPWDPVAGDYAAEDGWIRLHTNAPHHRAAALAVLHAPEEKAAVTAAVARWKAVDLESAIVDRGGCAAAMKTIAEWRDHPQGAAVASEPLVFSETHAAQTQPGWRVPVQRPLEDIRVLDLTRVLAGPVATRFLAGFGAEVLRIDPPGWDEVGVVPETALGKRCAVLDLRRRDGIAVFELLLAGADVLVHGYRPGALEGLGLSSERRRSICPGLVDVSLDAYGFAGPWHERRGFDSLVQMSTGIADAGMRRFSQERPTPLPVQALDQAAGYLMAAAVIRGLTTRLQTGAGCSARTSLTRVAQALIEMPAKPATEALAPELPSDLNDDREETTWGPARRLRAPLTIDGTPMHWDYPATALGSAPPAW